MTIIELPQGYYGDLTGVPKDEAIQSFTLHDAAFLERNPSCAAWHRPSWRELEAKDTKTAPWGYVWYVVDEAGLLKFHSAQYDSSG